MEQTIRLGWLQRNLKGDPILWAIVILFSVISVAVVYSATTLAYRQELHGRGGSVEFIALKHTSLILAGLVLMWLAHRIDYRHYSRLSLYALLLSVPLLLYTYFFGGTTFNDASRWLTIPVINQTFQPSDLAKLALITHLARQRLGTVISRVSNFTDAKKKPQFQLEHSFIAIATGGVSGKGPGKSTERNIMPHPYSDFIYAIIIEEYGMIGGLFSGLASDGKHGRGRGPGAGNWSAAAVAKYGWYFTHL
nr:hypothetical protein [Tanacetum cinerariifolium]